MRIYCILRVQHELYLAIRCDGTRRDRQSLYFSRSAGVGVLCCALLQVWFDEIICVLHTCRAVVDMTRPNHARPNKDKSRMDYWRVRMSEDLCWQC